MNRPYPEIVSPTPWSLPPAERAEINSLQVGVLALQGGVLEHKLMLRHLGINPREVRTPVDLEGLQGLIIPGGESTTIAHLLDLHDLRDPLCKQIQTGLAVWGTCAGLILLAKQDDNDVPRSLGLMNIQVKRNAYGSQIDSFFLESKMAVLGDHPFPTVFIRAPVITTIGTDVEVLATLPNGSPIAARQHSMLGTTFHPELTGDPRFHSYFLDMIAAY